MKNELRKNGSNRRDYDFFDEAMNDFFPSFFGTGRHTVTYFYGHYSKSISTQTGSI